MAGRVNQSRFALLGLLSLGPQSGYDLKQLIAWSVGHFWREGYGQIYPTLKQLQAEGLVEPQTTKREAKQRRMPTRTRESARPERKVYVLTEAGRKRLREWLSQPTSASVPRNETLLKLFFGAMVPGAVNRKHVLEERERHAAALSTYDDIEQRLKTQSAESAHLQYWLTTLSYGRHVSRAVVAWADETLKDVV